MRVLLIEDHPLKQAHVIGLLQDKFPDVDITSKNSYISGLRELIRNFVDYDLLLLDISMPNYDISSLESGGDWMPLAGKKVLKEMYLREIPTKAIVVTMHGSFDDGTRIADLDNSLKNEFSENYIGYVFYSQISEDWKQKLTELIEKVSND